MINDIHKAYTMHEVDDLYLQTEKKKTALILLSYFWRKRRQCHTTRTIPN